MQGHGPRLAQGLLQETIVAAADGLRQRINRGVTAQADLALAVDGAGGACTDGVPSGQGGGCTGACSHFCPSYGLRQGPPRAQP